MGQPFVVELDDEFAVYFVEIDVRGHVIGLFVAELVARVRNRILDDGHRLVDLFQRRAGFHRASWA